MSSAGGTPSAGCREGRAGAAAWTALRGQPHSNRRHGCSQGQVGVTFTTANKD